VPAEYASRRWEPETALRELLRGRLQAAGPTSATALASDILALPRGAIDSALCALESEGFVMRGQFSPGGQELEWCERRLLARIHRYTIKSLRAEIEPVASADFMRFLLDWQGVTALPRPEGVASLERVIEQLEGFEIPAIAWESDVLAARLQDYDGAWLDSLCLSGRAFWARLVPPESATAAPVRATPMALLTRRNRALWQQWSNARRQETQLSAHARAMAEFLQRHGASFFDEIVHGAGLLRRRRRVPWANSWPRAAPVPTASAGCARCCCRCSASAPRAAGAPGCSGWMRPGAGVWYAARRHWPPCHRPTRHRRSPPPPSRKLPWRRSRGCCCAAMAWCFGACWRAKPNGCPRGTSCCAPIGVWRRRA
jgi:hypothetical protein